MRNVPVTDAEKSMVDYVLKRVLVLCDDKQRLAIKPAIRDMRTKLSLHNFKLKPFDPNRRRSSAAQPVRKSWDL